MDIEGMKTVVRAERVAYRDAVEIAVIQPHGDGGAGFGSLVFQRMEPGCIIPEPTLSLKTGEAQFLMDELWRCGLRPSEGSGSAGSLAATERHLKDMQSVAFGLLKRQGVER